MNRSGTGLETGFAVDSTDVNDACVPINLYVAKFGHSNIQVYVPNIVEREVRVAPHAIGGDPNRVPFLRKLDRQILIIAENGGDMLGTLHQYFVDLATMDMNRPGGIAHNQRWRLADQEVVGQ